MFSMCGPSDRARGLQKTEGITNVLGSQKNGFGRQVFSNGDEYEGEWKQHKPEGKGRYKWNGAPQKQEYFGEWMDGLRNGEGKLETFSFVPPQVTEKTYEGQWTGGKAHGDGIRVEANGSEYHGEWRDDKQHGLGIEITKEEQEIRCVYTGHFEKGKRDGYGEMVWTGMGGKAERVEVRERKKKEKKNEDGEEENDDPPYPETVETGHGSFEVFWTEKYWGNFVDNKMHGYGRCVWRPGGREYKGQWLAGKMHGFGVHTWKGDLACQEGKANLTKDITVRTYTGFYENDKKHGHGILDYGDGRKYEGQFKENKLDGAGKYTNTFLKEGMKADGDDKEGDEVWWEGVWHEGRHLRWTDGNVDNVVHDLRQAEQYTVEF